MTVVLVVLVVRARVCARGAIAEAAGASGSGRAGAAVWEGALDAVGFNGAGDGGAD